MNIENSKLYIKKRSLSDVLVFLVFVIPLVSQLFIDIFKPVAVLTYFVDASLVVFVVIMVLKKA